METFKTKWRTATLRLVYLVALLTFLQSCNTAMDSVDPKVTNPGIGKGRPITTQSNFGTGFQGVAYTSGFQPVPNAVITFSNASGVFVVVCDAYGSYRIDLAAGNYYASITAQGYLSNSTAPGYYVCTGSNGFQTGNFFLTQPAAAGISGGVYDTNLATIPNSMVTFTKANNPSLVFSTFAPSGYYAVDLPTGAYTARASATGFTTYDSAPSASNTGSNFPTWNFFLNP